MAKKIFSKKGIPEYRKVFRASRIFARSTPSKRFIPSWVIRQLQFSGYTEIPALQSTGNAQYEPSSYGDPKKNAKDENPCAIFIDAYGFRIPEGIRTGFKLNRKHGIN